MNAATIGINPVQIQSAIGEHDMALMCEYMAHAMKKSAQQRMLSRLSLQSRKRIRALRKMQLQTTHLEAEFHRMVYDLERKHQTKHVQLFEKRKNIISGKYEPTDEECDFPDSSPIDPMIQFLSHASPENDSNSDEIDQNGVPNFWLNILKYVPMFESMVKESDEPLLQHLEDIRVTMDPLPDMSFTLEFVFAPNDYIENSMLTKAYIMKCEPEVETPFSFDGPEIYESKGCVIRWKDDKNLSNTEVKSPVIGQPKSLKPDSFFNFFNPPELPDNENNKDYDEINTALESDFEVGHYLKERIVPQAILYYTGEIDDDFECSSTFSSDYSEVEDEIDEDHQGRQGSI